MAKRKFTDAEREEVRRLCYDGRSGRLPESKTSRCAELYAISPAEYKEIHADAAAAANRDANPMAGVLGGTRDEK